MKNPTYLIWLTLTLTTINCKNAELKPADKLIDISTDKTTSIEKKLDSTAGFDQVKNLFYATTPDVDLRIRGLLVGSSGSYSLFVRNGYIFVYASLDGKVYQDFQKLDDDLSETLSLDSSQMYVNASVDNDGFPQVEFELNEHTSEILTTATADVISEEYAEEYLPGLNIQEVADYRGEIEARLSKDDGESYEEDLFSKSTYNISIREDNFEGMLKCDTCSDNGIYNVSGVVSRRTTSHLFLETRSIVKNSDQQEQNIDMPNVKKYKSSLGGRILTNQVTETIGKDSIILKVSLLKLIE